MNKNILTGIILAFVVIVGAGMLFASRGEDNSVPKNDVDSSQAQSADMSEIPSDLKAQIEKVISRQSMNNVVVVDVRTDEEWNESHATDAFHWGLVEHLEKGELPLLEKDMEIYVYCRSGNRSEQAIKILQEAGYTDLTNIRGLVDWVSAGGQTTTGIDGDNLPSEMVN